MIDYSTEYFTADDGSGHDDVGITVPRPSLALQCKAKC